MSVAKQSRNVVAIDFGTSTTLVAVRRANGIPEVISIGDQSGVTLMPSIIDFDDLANVGESVAVHRQYRSVKSDLTRAETVDVTDSESELAELRVSAIINEAIRRAKEQVPKLLEDSEVFVGCPALWSGRNRRRLATIVRDLGLAVDYGNVLDEPVAAGISWIRDQWLEGGVKPVGNVLVFDPGGGTLDVAYLRVAENKDAALPDISIYYAASIAKSGDYADSLLEDSLSAANARLRDFKDAPALRDAVRSLKEQLSFRTEGRVNAGAPVNAVVECDQPTLNAALRPLVTDMHRLIVNVVKGTLLRRHGRITPYDIRNNPEFDFSSKLAREIDYVVLAGGLSRIPLFGHELARTFPCAKLITLSNPQEAVVRGLCYGRELVHLNLPRPPISFVAKVTQRDATGEDVSEEICVYEAFSPIFRFENAMAGNGNIYASWTCTAKASAIVELFAITPSIYDDVPISDRLIAFRMTGSRGQPSVAKPVGVDQSTSDTFIRMVLKHDPRSIHGQVRFVLYPTTEIGFYGANCDMAFRVDDWSPTPGNFAIGEQIASSSIPVTQVSGTYVADKDVMVAHSSPIKSKDR
jgi:hypothetical protein